MQKKKEFVKKLRESSIEELHAELKRVNQQLFDFFEKKQVEKRTEKPHEKDLYRRERARVLTILREKQGKKGSK